MSTALSIALELPARVAAGLSAPATVRVRNAGAPVLVSARLDLFQGDVTVHVEHDGEQRSMRGWQADTQLHRVSLAARHELIGAINLLVSEQGPTFPTPGRYRIAIEYAPRAGTDALRSADVDLDVHAPASESEQRAAAILADNTASQALVRAEPDAQHAAIEALAAVDGTLDGMLARLLLAGASHSLAIDWSAIVRALGLDGAVRAVVMLSTPYSDVGAALAGNLGAFLRTSTGAAAASARDIARALAIVAREPVPMA